MLASLLPLSHFPAVLDLMIALSHGLILLFKLRACCTYGKSRFSLVLSQLCRYRAGKSAYAQARDRWLRSSRPAPFAPAEAAQIATLALLPVGCEVGTDTVPKREAQTHISALNPATPRKDQQQPCPDNIPG